MEPVTQSVRQSRIEERRKTFLVASLCVAGTTYQCRLRNMTQLGALVQCDASLPSGSIATIARGELRIAGEIRWVRNGHLGLKFSDRIEIHKWLGESSAIETSFQTTPAKPHLSDEPNSSVKQDEPIDDGTINQRLSEELLYVSRAIGEIGEILVKDPVLRIRHASSLQHLDMGQQMLAEIAQLVTIERKHNSIFQIASGPMRGRLLRAKRI